MSEQLLRTPCYAWHVQHGGRMVDFAGWEMPVQYSSIIDEHVAVRTAAGLFDIAHMGRLRFSGPDACGCLDYLVTNDVTQLKVGQIRYALVTNDAGGILDDVLVYRFDGYYLLVVNASNREKIVDWIERHRSPFDVEVTDLTLPTSMLAVQGPRSGDVLAPLIDIDLRSLRFYYGAETRILNAPAVVSRTGYTGEDGFEVILPAAQGVALWERLLADGAAAGLKACGLGSRDTLRLEAAMPLYGHELNESIDPFTAGLDFAVKLDTGDFIGKRALIEAKLNEQRRRRVGLILSGRRIAREGSLVFQRDQQVGEVTSGTFSPTLQKSIAMAFLAAECSSPGAEVEIDVRGKREPAIVTPLPFYRRLIKSSLHRSA